MSAEQTLLANALLAENLTGLSAKDMSSEQLAILKKLVKSYIYKQNHKVASSMLDTIKKEAWESFSFAWAGSLERHKGNYYFIQSSSFLFEYDNTQNGNNHIHAVEREINGIFDEDVLSSHRKEHH